LALKNELLENKKTIKNLENAIDGLEQKFSHSTKIKEETKEDVKKAKKLVE